MKQTKSEKLKITYFKIFDSDFDEAVCHSMCVCQCDSVSYTIPVRFDYIERSFGNTRLNKLSKLY